MKITSKLKKFLEDNKDLIISNDYDKLYEELRHLEDPSNLTPSLTNLLYKAGIDPLNYMADIPEYYAYDLPVDYIHIPNNIARIGSAAFAECSSLTTITIPASVTSIGGSAFYGCSNLTTITIPEKVTSIGMYAFDNCPKLKKLEFSPNSSLERIGPTVFPPKLDELVLSEKISLDLSWGKGRTEDILSKLKYPITYKGIKYDNGLALFNSLKFD